MGSRAVVTPGGDLRAGVDALLGCEMLLLPGRTKGPRPDVTKLRCRCSHCEPELQAGDAVRSPGTGRTGTPEGRNGALLAEVRTRDGSPW